MDLSKFSLALETPLCCSVEEERAALAAESLGWQPLGAGVYAHANDREEGLAVVTVVGMVSGDMGGMNILFLF